MLSRFATVKCMLRSKLLAKIVAAAFYTGFASLCLMNKPDLRHQQSDLALSDSSSLCS